MIAAREIVGVRVDRTSYADACERIAGWTGEEAARVVCVANVHVVMEAYDDPVFRAQMRAADLVTPDGMPLVWALKLLGVRDASRVYGPDLMPALCARAERDGIPVGLYGGTVATLRRLRAVLERRHPTLRIVYADSPPFRALSDEEDAATVAAMVASGARILFVGLGCPKQERWMAQHRGRLPAVMVGVGAAFDFLAGTKRQAPRWMMRAGLEWLFRLATEPRRLWRRYARHNPRFVALVVHQALTRRWGRQHPAPSGPAPR